MNTSTASPRLRCLFDLTERKAAEEKVRESEQRYREVQTELGRSRSYGTVVDAPNASIVRKARNQKAVE
jgi:PAS domain-containing protein